MDFMDLKVLMVHKENLKYFFFLNKEEKYIPVIQMVGLIKHSTMDFTNFELPN